MRGVRGAFLNEPVVHRSDRRTFACDLGRDALQNLAGGPAVDEDVEFRLPEQVDEPWRDHEIRRVDRDGRRCARERADRGDAVGRDADVASKPGRAGPVDDASVHDENVEARRGSLRRGCGDKTHHAHCRDKQRHR